MSSILTNNGAMVALQTLKSINSNLSKTTDEISTGKSVASAKDNASLWAISKVMEAEVSGFKAISSSMSVGASAVATARNGAESITNLLKEVRNALVMAQSESADHAKIGADIAQLAEQIGTVTRDAQFSGMNLLDGSITETPPGGSAEGIAVLASFNRLPGGTATPSYIYVENQDLTGIETDVAAYDLTDTAGRAAALADIELQLDLAIDAATAFGSAGKRIEIQSDFLSKLTDSLTSGIGAMVDADMEAASARLQALQTQQQLGIQALTIANQAPQNILALFRG